MHRNTERKFFKVWKGRDEGSRLEPYEVEGGKKIQLFSESEDKELAKIYYVSY